MQIKIISYSLTGNNKMLANNLANALDAKHIQITAPKSRTFFQIALDMIFNRKPDIKPTDFDIDKKDFIIFMSPVWMGHIASPLRTCFKKVKDQVDKFAFVSISGGAMGPNPKLEKELKKRLGKSPEMVIDRQKVEFLPDEPKPTSQQTSSYELTGENITQLTKEIVPLIKEKAI